MGPMRELEDPEFMRWSNLRTVVSLGLLLALLSGLFHAAVGGWGHVNVAWLVFTAVWIPLCFVGLHLWLRPRRSSPGE